MIYTICSECGREIPKGEKCSVCTREKYKIYNKSKRDLKSTIFYNSSEWKRLRDYVYRKYSNLCLKCLIKDNKIIKANVVHHILSIETNWEKRLLEDNLITLCHTCHNRIHSGKYDESKINDLYSILREYNNIYY